MKNRLDYISKCKMNYVWKGMNTTCPFSEQSFVRRIESSQLQWGQMMAHSLGYPTDIDRKPDGKQRSQRKQRSPCDIAVLGNQANTVIWWKLLEYFLVHKLCNSLDILIGLQQNTLYSKSKPTCNWVSVRIANSWAGIKLTAPLSAFDKENSIEFLLDSVPYLYMNSNPNPVL